MKKLKTYKLFEGYVDDDGYYWFGEFPYEWVKPSSEIRQRIENDIRGITYEITDLGYYYHTAGWGRGKPYVWISSEDLRCNVFNNDSSDVINRIGHYLKLNKFEVTYDTNNTEMRIYFANKNLK